MNERIQELAEQAGIYNLNLVDETEYWILEKFAELIIKECADVASEETSLPYNSYGEKIRKHFGVRE